MNFPTVLEMLRQSLKFCKILSISKSKNLSIRQLVTSKKYLKNSCSKTPLKQEVLKMALSTAYSSSIIQDMASLAITRLLVSISMQNL